MLHSDLFYVHFFLIFPNLYCNVADPNTLNLNLNLEFWPNLDPDPDPGLGFFV